MKISIITPSHNTRFLPELEHTILSQTHQDWEWIILLNGAAKFTPSVKDERIRIIECPFESDSVGFMKHLACMQASGDVIAEVDHDDLLINTCLEKVAKAFEDLEVGFVYSRNAKLTDKPVTYLPEYGWIAGSYRYQNKNLYAPYNQPVTPGRLGHIWFAPDHIRAWRRDVYEKIGGHNDALKVCDDLDLMHRLYMVTRFKEIDEVLYIYRITGDNTYLNKNELIKQTDNRLYDNNIKGLAERFCELNGLEILKLSGEDCFASLAMTGENKAGLVLADNVLQYVKDKTRLMKEIHRVLAKGGMLLSMTPSTDGRGAYQDPTFESFWNENCFWYYTKESFTRRIREKVLFRECRLATVYPDDFCRENKMAYVMAHLEKI